MSSPDVVCQKSFKLKTSRFTLLDNCGAPVQDGTTLSSVVNKGLTKITITPTYESPTAYLLRNGNDELEINEQGLPPLKWYVGVMELVRVDPTMIALVLGYDVITDESDNVTGWKAAEGRSSQFAVEGWQQLSGVPCVGADQPFGYRLLPYCVNPQISSDIVLQNDVVTFSISFNTHNQSEWGVGPYNVRKASTTPFAAGPLLTPVGPLEHFLWDMVTLAPPADACGAIALPDPDA
jgi:hypothetical protein